VHRPGDYPAARGAAQGCAGRAERDRRWSSVPSTQISPDSRKRLSLLAAIMGSFVALLDSTVVNVALPAIRRDLGTGLTAQQWIVEAYLLTLGSLVLVGGSLGDRLGRRRVFIAGLIGFGALSALCALAPNPGALIGARAVQGASTIPTHASASSTKTRRIPGESNSRVMTRP